MNLEHVLNSTACELLGTDHQGNDVCLVTSMYSGYYIHTSTQYGTLLKTARHDSEASARRHADTIIWRHHDIADN